MNKLSNLPIPAITFVAGLLVGAYFSKIISTLVTILVIALLGVLGFYAWQFFEKQKRR